MKDLITAAFISLSFASVATHSDANEACATELCAKAAKIVDLPEDVASFAARRDGCDHFRGEPWPEENNPIAEERRQFILKSISELCTGTDVQLKRLYDKYRQHRAIRELLDGYELRVE